MDAFLTAVRDRKEGLLADALLNDWVITDYGQGKMGVSLKNTKQKSLLPTLRSLVAQICGPEWEVIVTEDTVEAAPTLAQRYQHQAQDQREDLKNDPLLGQALDIFNNCVLTEVLPHD